ncbi:MAG: WD40 repeat domain-containing protein [Verrucomicrobia bacterium]|nr:WD40 repeat domain-containing protein [Verrucomicrobiota bacterium]
MKTALMAVVALAAACSLQAQQESESARALSGDPARGPLAFSPNGYILVTGADGLSLQLRNATSGDLSVSVAVPKSVGRDIAISPDGKWAAGAGTDGPDDVVWLWELGTRREKHTLRGHRATIHSIAFSSAGHRLASGSSDKSVRLWDTKTGELTLTLSQPDQAISGQRNRGIPGMVFAVAFSPDGTLLASGGGDGVGEYGEVVLWDLPSGKLRHRLLGPGEKQVWAVAFSPDQKLLVSGQVEGTIKLIDVSTGAIARQWNAKAQLRSLAISPDGSVLATGLRKDVKLWKLETGELQDTLSGHGNWVGSLSFSADGKLLASASSDGVKLWHLAKE